MQKFFLAASLFCATSAAYAEDIVVHYTFFNNTLSKAQFLRPNDNTIKSIMYGSGSGQVIVTPTGFTGVGSSVLDYEMDNFLVTYEDGNAFNAILSAPSEATNLFSEFFESSVDSNPFVPTSQQSISIRIVHYGEVSYFPCWLNTVTGQQVAELGCQLQGDQVIIDLSEVQLFANTEYVINIDAISQIYSERFYENDEGTTTLTASADNEYISSAQIYFTAIPEPSTYTIGAGGLLGIALLVRRRRQKRLV